MKVAQESPPQCQSRDVAIREPRARSVSAAVDRVPRGLLAKAIERDFGSVAQLQARFAAKVDELTSAGWVWLVSSQDDSGKLHVLTTGPNVFPLVHGYDALLERYIAAPTRPWIDRHARAEALAAWWCRVNWAQVGRRYEHSSRLHAPS